MAIQFFWVHSFFSPHTLLSLVIISFSLLRICPIMADSGGSSAVEKRMCSIPENFQLHLSMLALQFGYAGFHVVSRAALNMGISKIVFPVYRNILALFLLLPFAYFLEKKERPPLSWNLLLQFFLLAIVGSWPRSLVQHWCLLNIATMERVPLLNLFQEELTRSVLSRI